MHKVIVIPRKGLMIGASLEMLVCGLLACYTALLGVAEGNSLATSLLMVYFWLGFPIVYIADPHRTGFHWLILTSKGVEYHAIFRKKKVQPYSAYPYWAHGQYVYEGITSLHFLVLSDRKLTTQELCTINKVAASAGLIKIKMTKKNFRNLVNILPESRRATLYTLFPDMKRELYN